MTGAERRIYNAMHVAFFLLVAAAASRLVIRHGIDAYAVVSLAFSGALAVVYAVGIVCWDALGHAGRLAWFGLVMALLVVLVTFAPSFSWAAFPLFFMSLRLLGPRAAVVFVVLLTSAVIFAQVRLSDGFDPSLVLGPIAVAGMTTVIFLELQRLIDDLVRTRDELATTQRAAGVLAERERLAREIHDTLAQGLTSTGMLLQAADREWDADPPAAWRHVREASATVASNLEEARRFVRGLAPADLARASLPDALRAVVERDAPGGRLRVDGAERELRPEVQAALLRVAQGALANAREHAGARTVVVSLTYLDDEVTLDIADDGAGFDPAHPRSGAGRGYGLAGMRDRLAEVGGTLVIESAPGEGTVVAATIPEDEG
ncbi:sensor histidine kinase [Spirillospora sp. NPDC047279]|uniref:sensor histidine kinase n=1 Tax=Spirillospora sp. NPDC047279 TaxID=3155478 RepID=UPI0033F27433